MTTMLPKVLEIERYQLADYARVDYAITKGEDEIAALEELCLGPNELRRETSVVRDRTPRGSQEHGETGPYSQEHGGVIGRISTAAFTFCCGGHYRREFTRALLREFRVHTDPYAHLSLHRRDQGWRLRSRRKCSL